MQKCEQPEDKQFISKQEKAVFLAKFAFQQIFQHIVIPLKLSTKNIEAASQP